jgi:hypothetical protein
LEEKITALQAKIAVSVSEKKALEEKNEELRKQIYQLTCGIFHYYR